MPKSPPTLGSYVPNWYLGVSAPEMPYFGATSRFLKMGDKFLTHDGKHIVSLSHDGLTAMQNVCAHAGSQILSTPGLQPAQELSCPIHKWRYDNVGALTHAPNFCNHAHVALARPPQSMWNGYLLGMSESDARQSLAGFGGQLGSGYCDAFHARNFTFLEEKVVPVPYPRTLMAINYQDGAHVPLAHPTTFASVADCESYAWEMGPIDTPFSYSIQEVRAHGDVQGVAERALRMRMHNWRTLEIGPRPTEDDLGWASLHLWLKRELGDAPRPLDRDVFALWAIIYPYLMFELYEGGLLLAVSHLVSSMSEDPSHTNAQNPIEFYVHNSVPQDMIEPLKEKFIRAYMQSAHEDDELCLSLYAAHRRGPISFRRTYHEVYEAGDQHLADWFHRNRI
jgi:nitrite reductase/ring-hydroxylating ferredoxin subunit